MTFNDTEGKKVSTKVGDLAQISARGRNVTVVVHEVDVSFLPSSLLLQRNLGDKANNDGSMSN